MQLYVALGVLFSFYFVYTMYNAYHSLAENADDQDEGEIIRNCTCKDNHKIFYLVLTIVCFIVWSGFNTYHALNKLYAPIKKSAKEKAKQKLLSDDQIDFDNEEIAKKLKKTMQKKIVQCKKFVHLQHYGMFAIGLKNNEPIFNPEELKELIKIILIRPEFCKKTCQCSNTQDSTDSQNKLLDERYYVILKLMSRGLFHSLSQVTLFLGQLTIIPLLIFQMFDTHTFLCLAERNYCDTESQYKLHLDQTALSFSFYCALMMSLLVTKWLIQVPFPWKLEDTICYSKIIKHKTVNDTQVTTSNNEHVTEV